MKNVTYISLIAILSIAVSCKKNIAELNKSPTQPVKVLSASLFANASVNLADVLASTNVNVNNFRLYSQYWTETIYRDETQYNLNKRSIPDGWWTMFYRDIIKDLTEASKIIDEETLTLSTAQIKNRKAINEILMVYAYYHLCTTFGNIPYSQALDINNLKPSYDDAVTVFGKLATRLDTALSSLDISALGYGSSDLILYDDIVGWKRFANSLKFKMGMLIVDVDFAKASAMIVAAAPDVVGTNNENIVMKYLSAPPNTNPVWGDLVQSGRHDFVAARPFIDSLKKYEDPRTGKFYNETITSGGYAGETPGMNATFNDFSAPSDLIAAPDFHHTFFSYAEMELLKAEAIERGITAVGGTAIEHYHNGITASILEWGGSDADAKEYLSQPSVNYNTAPGDYKQKIGLQSWFALYNRGYDAWTQWRRLDYPELNVPSGAVFASGEAATVIKRMTYPVIEQNLNKANYNNASNDIGKDQITQRLWFDKF